MLPSALTDGCNKVGASAPPKPVSSLPVLSEKGKKSFSYSREAAFACGSRIPKLAEVFKPHHKEPAKVEMGAIPKTSGVSGLVKSVSSRDLRKERAVAQRSEEDVVGKGVG